MSINNVDEIIKNVRQMVFDFEDITPELTDEIIGCYSG
jgi:hypothetical protein